MMELDPGWKTSELWVAVGSKVLQALVVLGVLTSSRGEQLGTLWGQAVVGIFACITLGITAWHYVQTRVNLKHAAMRPRGTTVGDVIRRPPA
jgi:hypothetical protein